MNTIEEIAKVIKNAKSAAIFTHMRPDGDTVGSALALRRALSLRGVRAEVLNEGPIPARFSFFPPAAEILTAPTFDADVYIAVDSSDLSRLGALEGVFRAALRKKITINIDHHISNTLYAKYNFVRERASNCENIAELLRLLGVRGDKEIGDALMLGMVTDSGCFSHGDVTAATFREAAYAAEMGADVRTVVYETMKRRSRARAELYAEVVSRIRYLLDGKLAIATVPAARLSALGLTPDVTEGFVDFALTVDGVEVSICLLESGKRQYRASLRSKGKVDVNAVAHAFGGGGHTLAAGCMLFGELEEVIDRLNYCVYQHAGEV